MNFTKPLGLPALTVGLLLTASTALAQPVRFDQVDDNNDGFLSAEELEGALGSGATARLIERLDQDEDTLLSKDEVRAAADRVGSEYDEDEDDGSQDDDGETDDGETNDGENDDGENDQDDGDGEDDNRGHGNDEDGFDDDNPGRGHGDDGVPGGGRDRDDENGNGNGNRGGGNGNGRKGG